MKRRIISLMIAAFLILGMPLQALAATHEAEDFNDVYNAFTNDTDAEVTINLTNSIEWGGPLTANENQTYTVNGNGYTISGTVGADGGGTMNVNADISGSVHAYGGADVNVTGSVTSTTTSDGYTNGSIYATGEGSSVTVTGDAAIFDISVSDSGSVEVNGNVTAEYIYGSSYSPDENGEYIETSGEVIVNGDVELEFGINVGEGTVAIDGDVTGQYISINNGTASIDGNVTISDSEDGNGYIDVDNGGDLTVEGAIETENLWVNNSSELTAESIEADHISVSDNSKLTVEGNVSAVNGTTISENSTATIGGNITSENGNALQAIAGSTVTIDGDAIGGSDVFTPEEGIVIANGGVGVVADDSNVTVKGDVVGGSVIAPADATMNQGGIGVAAMGSAVVNIDGNVTGGNATEGKGIGGFGVYYDDYERPFTGSVTVGGTVTGGKGGPNGIDGPAYVSSSTGIVAPTPAEPAPEEDAAPVAAPVVTVPLSLGSDEVEIPVAVSNDEIVIETLAETEIQTLLESLKETVNEDSSDTVTIDVSSFKDVSSVRFSVDVLKAIIEAFGKLEIIFDGGVMVIDAAAFEKLVAELGFVTIALK